MFTKEDKIRLIETLSNANGPSGFEDEVIGIAAGVAGDVCDASRDRMNNLYLKRRDNGGGRPVIWLDAHSDEVGFIVQAIRPNGTLAFLPVGGWNNANVPSSKVRVRNEDGVWVPGIVAAKPVHFMSAAERGKVPEFSDMSIDIGACSAKEVEEKFRIRVAAPVVPDVACEYDDEHDLFLGKAFDCRVGCAALLDTLYRLAGEDLACDVEATLTSQEEVGERGASAAAGRMKHADVCVLFEGCPADDTFTPDYLIQAGLRRGPMLRHFDVCMITNPRFQRYVLDLAKEKDIPVQEAVRAGGGTNAGIIHKQEYGIPCVVIGIPVRYIHSHHGYCTLEDYESAVRLAVAICEDLTAEKLAEF